MASEATHRTHKNNIINIIGSKATEPNSVEETTGTDGTNERHQEDSVDNQRHLDEHQSTEVPLTVAEGQLNERQAESIDLNDFMFAESFSKNSGVTTDG